MTTTKKRSAAKTASKKAVAAEKTPATKAAGPTKAQGAKLPSTKASAKKTPAPKAVTKKTAAKSGGSKAAKKSSGGGRKYSPAASKNVERELHEMHEGKLRSGKSGKKVTNPKQAIAIALSEARRAGKKVPPNPNDPKKN